MRNLKRALSLALAFVMVMSLMIVGTSAKSYTDADKIDNQVAVEILGELGVMIGNDDGSFAPDRDVTRAEMAVLITRILYGNNMNVDQFKNMNTFTDVPDWAEGFVNLCASLDIIAGRGNGIFDPDATVTTAEAALMLSRALGYFKNNAEFGNDWALAAMKRATQAGIIGGDMVLQANAGLDRDDVAQMTFNTLTQAVPVQYNELLDVYYNVNQGVIYALEFNYLQTLGYTNFGLVYKTNDSAEYGRPATTWGIGSYKVTGTGTSSGIEKAELTAEGGLIASNVRMLDKDQIITVKNTPDYVYDNGTKEKDIYSDVGATASKYEWTAFVNGEEVDADAPAKNGSSNYEFTEKGAVTEVYVDDYAETVTVVEINYYLGQVYSVEDGTTTIRSLSTGGKVLDDRTFATEEFDEDEYVVFTVDYNDDEDFYICEMMAPETATGDVVRVENDNDSNDAYIRLDSKDGDKIYYTTDDHMVYDVNDSTRVHPTLNEEYILYMTPAGYILGFELANEKVPQYLYVKDSDEEMNDWNAKVILPDATQPKVDLDNDLDDTTAAFGDDEIAWEYNFVKQHSNIDELIWDYSVNSSDVYGLTYVPQLGIDANENSDLYQNHEDGMQINNGKAYVNNEWNKTAFIVDEKTIFVDTMNDVAYTGYNEVPDVDNAELAYVVEDGVAQIVFILDGEIYDANATYFFLTSTDWESEEYEGDLYREYQDAYVDGKAQKLLIAYDALIDGTKISLREGVLYKAIKTIDDEYITEVEMVAALDMVGNTVIGAGNITTPQFVGSNAFKVTDTDWNVFSYTTNSDTQYVLVEREPKDMKAYKDALASGTPYTSFDWNVSVGRLSNMEDDLDYGQIFVTVAKANDNVAELVYIYQIVPNYVGDQYSVTVNGDNINVAGAETTYDKGDDVTVTITPATGYVITGVTGDGVATVDENGVYTVKINNISKDAVINVTTAEKTEPAVLTLQGNLNKATIWSEDGTQRLDTTSNTATNVDGDKIVTLTKGNKIIIKDSNITVTGKVELDGVLATADGTKNTLSFTLNDSMEIGNAPTSTLDTFTFDKYVTPSNWKDSTGKAITPIEEDGVYYAARGTKVTVTLKDTSAADVKVLGLPADGTRVASGSQVQASGYEWTTGGNSAFFAGTQVTAGTDVTAKYDKAGTATDIGNSAVYVALDTVLTIAPASASDGTGVIADKTGSTVVGKNEGTTYTVGTEDVALVGAFEVTLNNVTAKVGTVDLASGDFVKKGETLTTAVVTGMGTTVIEKVGATKFAAAAFDSNVDSDLNLVAAIKITGTINTTVTYKSESTGANVPVISKSTTPVYVEVGTELTAVSDTTTIKVNGDTAANLKLVIDGSTAKFTTTNKDLTLADA